MYYALVKNNQVITYPYSVFDFRRDNKNVSLPLSPTDQQLNEVGMFFVNESKQPAFNFLTEKVEESTPLLNEGKYIQAWSIIALTDSEIEANMESKWAEIRSERDFLLSKCDWTQLPDVPFAEEDKQKWAIYRQALRDITNQEDPYNIVWPSDPDTVISGE